MLGSHVQITLSPTDAAYSSPILYVRIAYDFSTGWPCTDGPRAFTPDKNKRAIGQKTTVIHHPTLLSF